VLLTVYRVVFGGVNSLRSWPELQFRPRLQGRNTQECVTIDDKTLFVHLLVKSNEG
jgi:hypothetical protein